MDTESICVNMGMNIFVCYENILRTIPLMKSIPRVQMSTMAAYRSAKQSSQEWNNLGKAGQEFKRILDTDGDLEHAHILN